MEAEMTRGGRKAHEIKKKNSRWRERLGTEGIYTHSRVPGLGMQEGERENTEFQGV